MMILTLTTKVTLGIINAIKIHVSELCSLVAFTKASKLPVVTVKEMYWKALPMNWCASLDDQT